MIKIDTTPTPTGSQHPLIDFDQSFAVERKLDEGSLAQVDLVRFKGTSRHYARKKLLEDENNNGVGLARLENDYYYNDRLAPQSPHILQPWGFSSVPGDGIYYLLPFVAGCHMGEFLKAESLPRLLALQVSLAVCKALTVVHQQDIVHGDVKPRNILFCPKNDEPQVALIDFDGAFGLTPEAEGPLATLMEEGKGRFWIKTPGYCAPERLQAQGNDADVTTASDVYSLGIVLWEFLARTRLFGRDTAFGALLAQQEFCDNDLGRYRWNNDVFVPDGLREIGRSMMANDANDRPRAEEVVPPIQAEIERVLEGGKA